MGVLHAEHAQRTERRKVVAAIDHRYYRWHAHFYDVTRWAFLFGRTALIRLAAGQLRPRRILEVGCGTGRILRNWRDSSPMRRSLAWIFQRRCSVKPAR